MQRLRASPLAESTRSSSFAWTRAVSLPSRVSECLSERTARSSVPRQCHPSALQPSFCGSDTAGKSCGMIVACQGQSPDCAIPADRTKGSFRGSRNPRAVVPRAPRALGGLSPWTTSSTLGKPHRRTRNLLNTPSSPEASSSDALLGTPTP